MKEILKDKKSKFETLRALELIHKREIVLKNVIRNKILKTEVLEKLKIMKILDQNLNRWRSIESKMDTFCKSRSLKTVLKVIQAIRARVRRKKIFN